METSRLKVFEGKLNEVLRKWTYFKVACTSSATGLTSYSYTGHYGNSVFPPSLLIDYRFVCFPEADSQLASELFTEDAVVMVVNQNFHTLTYVFSKANSVEDSLGNSAVYRWNPVQGQHYDLLDSSMWVHSLGMVKSPNWIPVYYRPLAMDMPSMAYPVAFKPFLDPGDMYVAGKYDELVAWFSWLVHTYQGMFTTIGEEFTISPLDEKSRALVPDKVKFSWAIGLMDETVSSKWIKERWAEYCDIRRQA